MYFVHLPSSRRYLVLVWGVVGCLCVVSLAHDLVDRVSSGMVRVFVCGLSVVLCVQSLFVVGHAVRFQRHAHSHIHPHTDHPSIISINQPINQSINQPINQPQGDAGQQIYQFLWDEYADWYIEASKTRMADPEAAQRTREGIIYM